MAGSKWIIVALVAVVVAGGIFAFSQVDPPSGIVAADEFAKLAERGARVVDVRTASEYAAGHLPGAQNVPLSSFSETAVTWDPAEPIALYCATGNRSAEALQILTAAGFEHVYDLSGGIVAWNGPLTGGSEEGVVTTAPQSPSGLPVMYEFYTDW